MTPLGASYVSPITKTIRSTKKAVPRVASMPIAPKPESDPTKKTFTTAATPPQEKEKYHELKNEPDQASKSLITEPEATIQTIPKENQLLKENTQDKSEQQNLSLALCFPQTQEENTKQETKYDNKFEDMMDSRDEKPDILTSTSKLSNFESNTFLDDNFQTFAIL